MNCHVLTPTVDVALFRRSSDQVMKLDRMGSTHLYAAVRNQATERRQ
ncbi:MAG: hypothetical protein ACYCZB_01180 [Acidiphilium sp.]